MLLKKLSNIGKEKVKKMFEVERGFIYKTVSLRQDGVKIELESFKEDDHAKQADFVFSILDELSQMTSCDADDILIDKICKKYNLQQLPNG